MPHWPAQQSHAFIVRTTRADRTFDGIDLSLLGDELKPDVAVTAADLERDGVTFPKFYGDDMLLPVGKTPAYLGHAVAIMIYHDFARFRFAKDKLKYRDEVVRYGAQTGALERDPWGTFRFVRVGGATPFDDDVFSSLKFAPVFPARCASTSPFGRTARTMGRWASRVWPMRSRSATNWRTAGQLARAGSRVQHAVDRYRRARGR
jgi:CO/xanthine dehydrogenase Mo-binding subunit